MVPFHILAGALDRPGTNILFNWVVPILLVVWAVKQSTGAGDDATAHAASPEPQPSGLDAMAPAVDATAPQAARPAGPARRVAVGAADPEVVAATATRIAAGDPDAWLREWTAAGGEAWAAAGRTGDAALYLHAASYYAAALAVIADTDGSVDEARLWQRQRDCWDRAASGWGASACRCPTRAPRLPGYFFCRRPGAAPARRHRSTAAGPPPHRPGLAAGAAAHARGYHWMTFDGPGRQAALRRQGLVLRPDWEAVLAPVADAMTARADVDASRMAVVGCELAAFGVTRALAYEHRFAAAVVAPGIVDASRPWLDALPAPVRAALLDARPRRV